jgi:hypothetical protein
LGGVRPWIAVAGLVILALMLPIMLAERAPDLARGIGRWVETSDNALARFADSLRLPRSAFEIHVVAWAAAGLVAGLLSWSWRSFVALGAAALAASLGLEVAQGVLTETRSTSLSDAVGNTIGIAVGLGAAAVATLAWVSITARFRGQRDQEGEVG